MKLTDEMIETAMDELVDLFNKQLFEEVGNFFDEKAVLTDGHTTVFGRSAIIEFFETMDYRNIASYQINSLQVAADGQQALVSVQVILACNAGRCVHFYNSCSSLLFQVAEKPSILAGTTIMLKRL